MISTLIFDIGGVCLTDSFNHPLRKIFAQRYTIPIDHVEAISEKYHDARVSGQIDEVTFLQYLCEGYKTDIESIQRFIRDGIKPVTGTIELLHALKATRRYRLLSINNEAKGWGSFRVTHFQLDKLFDAIYTSCDIGVFKPDQRIFELVIERESLIPSETVFIDNKARNLPPAAQLGMETILFQNPEQLQQELRILGIAW